MRLDHTHTLGAPQQASRRRLPARARVLRRLGGAASPRLYPWLGGQPGGLHPAPRALNLKFTGLTQNLGQLYGSYRDYQSNFWVNLRILGQPCEFYVTGITHLASTIL